MNKIHDGRWKVAGFASRISAFEDWLLFLGILFTIYVVYLRINRCMQVLDPLICDSPGSGVHDAISGTVLPSSLLNIDTPVR